MTKSFIDNTWEGLLADLPTNRKKINFLKKQKRHMEFDMDGILVGDHLHGKKVTDKEYSLMRYELSVIDNHLNGLTLKKNIPLTNR